ncbi:MAG: NADH-quinone oxidoreductase subunit NuoG [Chloracidobacterium sp.]|nr:NADH-quinone oxidoreductase subunit NuoG [Chloracidobacterium sp.]
MATIFVENQSYQAEDGQNLLHACLSLGFDLPYFCWHPALGSVGACRQCAVKQFKDAEDTQGRLVMACMTPASEGARISIEDRQAREFRASVIEWLMVNHPHDCPVCDEGGECHLQDMTVMTGHDYRHFRFRKRTYRNQYLGPFINHEMNRCIQCYRCVRFYRDYAGGRDLDVFGAHDHVYFGRHEDGFLENEFSGNLVEVCPTGVFTDKTLKERYTRKWDLQTAPSVCAHCGVGCNTIPGERYGVLRRILNRYHHDVNGYFLCDRGRFGYEFVNSPRRIRRPMARADERGAAEVVTGEAALRHGSALLSGFCIGVGSPRASLEANFALRALVGAENFYTGMSELDSRLVTLALRILREGPARSPSLREVEMSDAVLALGEDLTNTAPMLALALRQSARRRPMKIAEKLNIPQWDDAAAREAIQHMKGPVYIATPDGAALDDIAIKTYRAAPDDIARLGFAVAHALDAAAPPAPDLSEEARLLADDIGRALRDAERPLVVSGPNCASEAVMRAAANVAWALCANGRDAGLCFTMPECDSLGVSMLCGGDGGGGRGVEAVFKAVEKKAADTLIILENDLYRRAGAASVDALLSAAGHVIIIDHLVNAMTPKAELVLPAATFAEADGTLVNNEGRAQRFYQVIPSDGEIRESWRWLRDLMVASGREEAAEWRDLDDITAAMAREIALFEPIPKIAPPASFRVAGEKIPRQPQRYSGRAAMLANVTVHEPKPPDDPDSPLAFSMEGYEGQPPPPLITRFWSPGWNSVQALNKFQSEVGGPLRGGDPGRRLIEPAQKAKATYFNETPAAFRRRDGEWLIIPLHHIFGSEELSALSPGVAERSPRPYLALNSDDAGARRMSEGEEVELVLDGAVYRLPVRLHPALPRGVAGLPAGMRQWAALPGWGRISTAIGVEDRRG